MTHSTRCGIPVTDPAPRAEATAQLHRLARRIKDLGLVGTETVELRRYGLGWSVVAHAPMACSR